MLINVEFRFPLNPLNRIQDKRIRKNDSIMQPWIWDTNGKHTILVIHCGCLNRLLSCTFKFKRNDYSFILQFYIETEESNLRSFRILFSVHWHFVFFVKRFQVWRYKLWNVMQFYHATLLYTIHLRHWRLCHSTVCMHNLIAFALRLRLIVLLGIVHF